MSIWLSRNLAIFIGVLAPLLDTIRRWKTWTEYPPAMLDDYFLGALLLYGAWRVSRNAVDGQRFLSAAWGVALGMIFLSFFGQIEAIMQGKTDSAPVSSEWVAVIKGIGFLIVIVGSVTSLRKVSITK